MIRFRKSGLRKDFIVNESNRITYLYKGVEAMNMYDHMKSTFINEYKQRDDAYKARMTKWRSEAPIVRAAGPTNIARARRLGYRAKEGILISRVRVRGGTSKRAAPGGGRKPSKSGRMFTRAKSLQAIAEERAARKFSNCEVLNSYFVGAAGSDKFYEVILLDRASTALAADRHYSSIITQRGRAYRGMTFQGRKHRGISRKGYGTINRRPSKRSNEIS